MKHKNLILIVVLMIITQAYTYAQLDKLFNKAKTAVGAKPALSVEEVAEGLKEALVKGTTTGTDQVSKVDGYFKNLEIKIPFPPDVQRVETKLRQIGMGNQVDKFVETLNRGAEDAAKEAKPIFITAVKSMTIEDAWSILKGQQDAATQYLQKTTSGQLKEKFKPVIQNSLDKVNATKYYTDLVITYNKIPLVEKVNPDLNEYATDMAMKGLFIMIAKEEKNIRENPVARTSDLLKKVFANQK